MGGRARRGGWRHGAGRPAGRRALVRAFESAGEVFQTRPDLQAVQAGKLLLNLPRADHLSIDSGCGREEWDRGGCQRKSQECDKEENSSSASNSAKVDNVVDIRRLAGLN